MALRRSQRLGAAPAAPIVYHATVPDATATALLTTGARALAALRQVVALHAGRPRAAAPMLVQTVEQARASGRREGARTMAIEVRQALPEVPALRDLDHKYAERAVAGYLKALDGADEKREAGETVHVPSIVEAKLDMIAATEVPGAFSEERERIERRVVEDNPTLAPVLVKLWNAQLDGACPVCRRLHRTSRPWGVSFGAKEPGRAHPRCQCFATYMPIPIVLRGSRRQEQRIPRGMWEVVE